MPDDRPTLILRAATKVVARDGTRGMRVDDVAREAGVSTALLYYHFNDRAGLLKATLEYVNASANAYTEATLTTVSNPREHLEQLLMLELQDDPQVLENSRAWGELRACAVFDEYLQPPLRQSTQTWNADIARVIQQVVEQEQLAGAISPEDTAERLTSLVEGLSQRWLSGTTELATARRLLQQAVDQELTPSSPTIPA